MKYAQSSHNSLKLQSSQSDYYVAPGITDMSVVGPPLLYVHVNESKVW